MTCINSTQLLLNTSQIHAPSLLSSIWDDIFPLGVVDVLQSHPFLKICRAGQANSVLLSDYLMQHQYYSQYFTRYLYAMMASLQEQRDVKALAHNLFDEMGLEGSLALTHAELYLQSMAAAGAVAKSKPISLATEKLINAMFRYCRSPDPLDGLAALCLGAEAIVPVVYGAVLLGLKHLEIPAEGLRFFEIHVAEDEHHALVMRGIIDRLLTERPEQLTKVQAIGAEMVKLRMAMFDDVLAPI